MLVSVTRTADGSLEGQRWEVTVTIRGPEHAEQASRDAPVPVEELARGKRVRGRSSPSMTWCARGLFESDEEWQEFLSDLYACRRSGLA